MARNQPFLENVATSASLMTSSSSSSRRRSDRRGAPAVKTPARTLDLTAEDPLERLEQFCKFMGYTSRFHIGEIFTNGVLVELDVSQIIQSTNSKKLFWREVHFVRTSDDGGDLVKRAKCVVAVMVLDKLGLSPDLMTVIPDPTAADPQLVAAAAEPNDSRVAKASPPSPSPEPAKPPKSFLSALKKGLVVPVAIPIAPTAERDTEVLTEAMPSAEPSTPSADAPTPSEEPPTPSPKIAPTPSSDASSSVDESVVTLLRKEVSEIKNRHQIVSGNVQDQNAIEDATYRIMTLFSQMKELGMHDASLQELSDEFVESQKAYLRELEKKMAPRLETAIRSGSDEGGKPEVTTEKPVSPRVLERVKSWASMVSDDERNGNLP